MKKIVLIIIATLLVAAGGYFAYQTWWKKTDTDIWALVPRTSIFVYESTNSVKAWNSIYESTIWKNLSSIPYFNDIQKDIILLDSLSGKNGNLDKLLRNQPFLLSVHPISKEQFGYLFILEINNLKENEVMYNVLSDFKARKNIKNSDHSFNNFTITDIRNPATKEQFSYFFYDNYFIGSFTPFLVEDVVRQLNNPEDYNFKRDNPSLFQIAKTENDEGNIYVNLRESYNLFTLFAEPNKVEYFKQLRSFASSTFLDTRLVDDNILLNGYTYVKPGEQDYLQAFNGQKQGKLNVKSYLPNNTALLFHFSFSSMAEWHKNLELYWHKNYPEQLKKWNGVKTEYGIESGALLKGMGNEISFSVQESVDPQNPDKLVFVLTDDMSEAWGQLNRLAENLNKQSGDSLYLEPFANTEIREIAIKEFPSILFGNLFTGFDQCFYAPVGNYIAMGNNVQALKNMLKDVEAENTWGRSVKQVQFLENILQETNVSVVVNTRKFWEILIASLSPHWEETFQKNASYLKSFEMAAVQFGFADDAWYTSVSVKSDKSVPEDQQQQQLVALNATFLESRLVTKPFVFRSHVDNTLEVFVQDSLNQVYLISKEGKILWKDSIGSHIEGDVRLVDYYNNRKFQFYFVTNNAIHIIDRNGNYIPGYPINILGDGARLHNAALIDYDNSKNFRYLISDTNGNLYMYDKNGEVLEGWNPKKLSTRLAAPAFHLRTRGRDFMVAVQENGLINVMTRRGELYPGFPIDAKARLKNPIFVEAGPSFESTILTTISEGGELIKFNLDGKFAGREQLYRPSKDTRFKMCLDGLERTFVIARQDKNRVGFLDRKGELIFEKDFITSDDMEVQFYNFGSGNEVYAITDRVQEFTYIYNSKGKLINSRPIESSNRIGVIHSENASQYQIYSNYGNRSSILGLKE